MLRSARLFALGFLSVSVAVGVAHAANELCGQTITQSLTLAANQACTGDGLVVVGDGITIDLGGFTLSGDGGNGDDGIDVTGAGSGAVVIKNGTVRNFDIGIATHGMAPDLVKVSKVTLRNNGDSGFNVTADQIVVDKCSVSDNGLGLRTVGTNVKINATSIVGNTSGGIDVSADTLTVTKALVMGNGGRGLALGLGGSKVVIKSSQFVRNQLDGIQLAEATTTPGSMLVAKNRIIGNGGSGVLASGGDDVNRVVAVVVSGNLIAGNGDYGVLLANDSDNSVVAGNRIIGNGVAGVAIAASSDGVLVKGNAITGHDIAGIGAENPSATLAKNVMTANAVAILAPSGAIDGGGNKARANIDQSCSTSIACPPTFIPKPGPVIPTCGMHVTESITLGADTPPCSSDGIIVDADGVTIDLNGHQVRGNGTPGTSGIEIAPFLQGLTVANGIVRGFGTGITGLVGQLKLNNLEVRDNLGDGAGLSAGDSVIDKSAFVNNGAEGLDLANSGNVKIKSSIFFGNGTDSHEGFNT